MISLSGAGGFLNKTEWSDLQEFITILVEGLDVCKFESLHSIFSILARMVCSGLSEVSLGISLAAINSVAWSTTDSSCRICLSLKATASFKSLNSASRWAIVLLHTGN